MGESYQLSARRELSVVSNMLSDVGDQPEKTRKLVLSQNDLLWLKAES
jgi:hypothetical protein